MKVCKLIEKLKEYNQEADITLTTSEEITLGYIFKTEDGTEYSKKTTKQVFIEPCDECPSCVHEYMNGDEMWCSFYDKSCETVEDCYQYEEFLE